MGLDVLNCCDETSSDLLVRCLNSSLARRERASFFAAAPYTNPYSNWERPGPSMSVVIVTRMTKEIYDYGSWSLLLQAAYAEVNGYSMLKMRVKDSETPDYQFHRKLVPMIEALEGDAYHADYLVWMDADLVILDFEMRIEQIAVEYPKAHIIMSADVSAPANTGMIIVRNTAWGLAFLKEWHKEHALLPPGSTDQMGFTSVYQRRPSSEVSERVALLSPHVLNSEAPPMGRQQPSHKVLHLAAESGALRSAVFRHGAEVVCRDFAISRSGKRLPLPPQLELTRAFLQRQAREVYRGSASALLQAFRAHCEKISTDELRLLRQAASKYSHALSYANGDQETEESREMRLKVFSSVHDCVTSLPSYRRQKSRALGDQKTAVAQQPVDPEEWAEFPEQLKLAVELGFEALNAAGLGVSSSSSSTMTYVQIAEFLGEALDVLHVSVHRSFLGHIFDMKAGFLLHMGQNALVGGKAKEGKALLLQAMGFYVHMNKLATKEAEAKVQSDSSSALGDDTLTEGQIWEFMIGDRVLQQGDLRGRLGTMASLAGAYCTLNEHAVGAQLYARALRLEASHVGEWHLNLADKYLNAGLCMRDGHELSREERPTWWTEGEALVLKAVEVLRRNGRSDPHIMSAAKKELARSPPTK